MARLLVSVPPTLRGEIFSGSSDSSIQKCLIRSWLNAGLNPVSLNTSSELEANPRHREALRQAGLEIIEVPPTNANFPSYLPNLVSALRLAVDRFPREVIAITNADIYVNLDDSTSTLLNTLSVDRFLISHRTDVTDDSIFFLPIAQQMAQEDASKYLPGIDFIAARAEALRAALPFLGNELTIGLRWWDLLLPMALISARATKHHLNSLQFLHLKHSDRWDVRWQVRIGISATRHLNTSIHGYRAPVASFIWSLAYQKLTSPFQSPRIQLSRLRNGIEYLSQRRGCPVYLDEVLRITQGMVCEQGWPLDKMWIHAWHPDPPFH